MNTAVNLVATFGQLNIAISVGFSLFVMAIACVLLGKVPGLTPTTATVKSVKGINVTTDKGTFPTVAHTYAPGDVITVQRNAAGEMLEDLPWRSIANAALVVAALLLLVGYLAMRFLADRRNVMLVLGTLDLVDLVI